MITVNGHKVVEEYFPDGTPKMLNMPEMEPCPQDVILWKFENISEQILLYNITMHLKSHGAQDIILFMPYLPNARMDKVKADTECFTLKYFTKFINDLGFSIVCVLDPHSNVSVALLDRVQVLTPEAYLNSILADNNYDIICFPDVCSYEKYSDMFAHMYEGGINLKPRIYCDKIKDWKTGKLLDMSINYSAGIPLEGKNILMVDDLCSRGGTFMMCAEQLKKHNVGNIDLWVTHCENSIFAGKLLEKDSPISKIWTTDSLKHAEHDKIFTFCVELDET